uniref:Zinc-ribbon domain-containing protein n=1 Tax=Muribaculaceae bacterium Z82 TaxID=2304548 RepID=A0A7C9JE83_9BACT
MSLVDCPECGHQASTYAAFCPNCGYPIASQKRAFLEALIKQSLKKCDDWTRQDVAKKSEYTGNRTRKPSIGQQPNGTPQRCIQPECAHNRARKAIKG